MSASHLSASVAWVQGEGLHEHLSSIILHERATVVRLAQRQHRNARARNLAQDWLLRVCRHRSQNEADSAQSNDLVLHVIISGDRFHHLQRVNDDDLRTKTITSFRH